MTHQHPWSWKAIGFYIYQQDPDDAKKRYYARFESITLNEREARFLQPKRELFGLMRALEEMRYWLIGCRKLIVKTDALYIFGMLRNPDYAPNATIHHWIEKVLMFHFTLRHEKGKTFGPDDLSHLLRTLRLQILRSLRMNRGVHLNWTMKKIQQRSLLT